MKTILSSGRWSVEQTASNAVSFGPATKMPCSHVANSAALGSVLVVLRDFVKVKSRQIAFVRRVGTALALLCDYRWAWHTWLAKWRLAWAWRARAPHSASAVFQAEMEALMEGGVAWPSSAGAFVIGTCPPGKFGLVACCRRCADEQREEWGQCCITGDHRMFSEQRIQHREAEVKWRSWIWGARRFLNLPQESLCHCQLGAFVAKSGDLSTLQGDFSPSEATYRSTFRLWLMDWLIFRRQSSSRSVSESLYDRRVETMRCLLVAKLWYCVVPVGSSLPSCCCSKCKVKSAEAAKIARGFYSCCFYICLEYWISSRALIVLWVCPPPLYLTLYVLTANVATS